MRSPIATMALTLAAAGLLATAQAQQPKAQVQTQTQPQARPVLRDPGVRPASGSTTGASLPASANPGVPALAIPPGNPASAAPEAPKPLTADQKVYRSSEEIPRSDIVPGNPAIALPTGPVDPFLLQKEHGPFMVMAKTFVGPDATKYAVALTRELREQFHLPAYIFFLRVKPGRSNIRNVPPTSGPTARDGDFVGPRGYDEAAVLVGNCKTTDEANELLHKVKKLHPVCLDGMPSFWHRKGAGLKYALMTTNPLVANQHLYPGRGIPVHHGAEIDTYDVIARMQNHKKADPLVVRMNGGPHSVYKCNGPYTLQVAEFNGRSTTNVNADKLFTDNKFLGSSPLSAAVDEAERLADGLERHADLTGGQRPFVYHDRTTSRVLVGSFRGPDDPALLALQKRMHEVSIALMVDRKVGLKVPLTATPVVLGTAEGAQMRDAMVQKSSATAVLPDMIPFPER